MRACDSNMLSSQDNTHQEYENGASICIESRNNFITGMMDDTLYSYLPLQLIKGSLLIPKVKQHTHVHVTCQYISL